MNNNQSILYRADPYSTNARRQVPAGGTHLLQPARSTPVQDEGKTQVQAAASDSANSGLQFGIASTCEYSATPRYGYDTRLQNPRFR